MYWIYLRRELAGRKKQTTIVAIGLAIAIALVIIVNALSAGVRDAQAQALASVYGVGTDLTVTGAEAEPGQGGGGGRFDFGEGGGQTSSDGTTTLSQSRLVTDFRRGTPDAATVDQVTAVEGVAAATGALSLTNMTFSGELPQAPTGGATGTDGQSGSVGGTSFEVVGIAASASADADTAANVYIPLDVAQTLSSAGDVVSTVYVQTTSSDGIASVQSALRSALPDATVSSQSDLAATVSGSLASAGSLITSLGTWLSIIVLAVAVALAVLFTISGISRRTRELGTLKAIGWSNSRVVGQVAGESVVQALIGGVAGVVLGLIGVTIINLVAPTISSAPAATAGRGGMEGAGGAGGMGAPAGGGGGGFGSFAQTASDIVLHAPLSLWIVLAALALAVAGGLVAGAFGGWRAARLSPAEVLRTVA